MTSADPTLTVSVPTQRIAAGLGELPEGVELFVWDMVAPAPRDHIDLVVLPYLGQSRFLPALANVTTRLVQSQSIGYDDVAGLLPPGHAYANGASIHEAGTAELALGLAIASQRRFPDYVRAFDEGRWAPRFSPSLADRRVLLLGYGGVGKAVAARLAPFEVELTIVARRARDEDGVRVHGVDELPALLPNAEVVILTLPANDATHHIIDAAALTALPDDALVVNVGRGPLIDTDALVAEGGRIRAALDVTDPEPLPEGHPLWNTPGVLLTPHVGGATTSMNPRVARLVHAQIERMLRDEPALNVVLPAR